MRCSDSHFPRSLVTLVLRMLGFLMLTSGAARAQLVFQDNLPCSSRRDIGSCIAECIPGNHLENCFCIWDPRPQVNVCPEGQNCCLNMPCARWDQQGSLQCLRGGGSPDGLTPKNCDYHPDGNGGGLCECVPPLVSAGYNFADFFVVNAVDVIPPLDCTCPYTTNEQFVRLGVCNPPHVSKLVAKLNFAKPLLNDSIELSGSLAVPQGFAVQGALLVVNIGGVTKTFNLDGHGKAVLGNDKAQLVVKATHGTVLAQNAKLSLKFTKGSFAALLADDGLVNQTVSAVSVSLPVEIRLNDKMFAASHALIYSATAGKSGAAK